MTIRKAQTADIPRIMDLLHQVNDVHAEGRPDLFIKGHTKYTPAQVADIIAAPLTPVFVYIDGEAGLLGYCFCIIQDHTAEKHLAPVKTLYIDDLCVDAAARGRHIGSALYEYVKAYAREAGFHNITLNVWAENRSAISFYESLGMKPYKFAMEQLL